jgi:hypothetical protein
VIISASRRTDIPHYYGDWFIRRVRAGYCITKNPFFPDKRYRISLRSEDVDCFVFWTRCPVTLMPHLSELEAGGYPYYFLYTLVDYPRILEPGLPALEKRTELFRELAKSIGAERTVWRYDPIYLSAETDFAYHAERFRGIAQKLSGYTKRVIVSFYDSYRKTKTRLKALPEEFRPKQKPEMLREASFLSPDFMNFVSGLAEAASSAGMKIQSCAEKIDLSPAGVRPGACIDAGLIQRLFGFRVPQKKDPNQRKRCRCALSRDIGAYETCISGCLYCYAAGDPGRARSLYKQHNPENESLV